jgi:hypothetical protein
MVTVIDMALPSRRRLWLSGVMVVLGVALLGLGFSRPSFDAEHPRPHTLFYAMNADTGMAQWASMDDDRDAWLAQFVPNESAEATTAEEVLGITPSPLVESDWLISSIPAWARGAPALSAPAPTITVLEDRTEADLRVLRLRAESPRGARIISVAPENEVVRASVAGKQISVYEGWRFVFVGLPPEGVELELTLRNARRAVLVVLDQTDGLPPSLTTGFGFSPEPEDTMPAILPRWARGYPAFVKRTYVLPAGPGP